MNFTISKLFQNNQITIFILTIFNKPKYNYKYKINNNLGRWSLLYDKKKLNRRIELANYDNCGVSKLN